MDAAPSLVAVADALKSAGLEAILIGNAAAALHGAPVTTVDFDFLYRVHARSAAKLKRFAAPMGGTLRQPFHGLSTMFRVEVPASGLQVDFTSDIHGVRSFNSLKSRCTVFDLDGRKILLAPLEDIIKSKKAAGRPRDLAVLHVLEATLARIQEADAAAPEEDA
jgi:hypothetical protein